MGKLNFVENDIRLSIGFKYAQHPLFEHDQGDAKIRAAIIVGLGCDTLPKGCPKLGQPDIRYLNEMEYLKSRKSFRNLMEKYLLSTKLIGDSDRA